MLHLYTRLWLKCKSDSKRNACNSMTGDIVPPRQTAALRDATSSGIGKNDML